MTTELFLGGLIVLTMAAAVIMALTQGKGNRAGSNDRYEEMRTRNVPLKDRNRR